MMSFWKGEECEYCKGPIVDRVVEVHKKVNGERVLIRNVPAGVCKECGTRYYSANVLKMIENKIRDKKAVKERISVPVFELVP